MDIIFVPLFHLIMTLLSLYTWILIATVIMSWLETFNIVNRYNKFVYTVHTILFRLTDPILSPIRRILPTLGGLDLSPLIVLLGVQFIMGVLSRLMIRFAF